MVKIFRLLSERRDLRLGLDGELAVAEELRKMLKIIQKDKKVFELKKRAY